MACCYDELGEYGVTPVLISPCPADCTPVRPTYVPYLPRCTKKPECCERRDPRVTMSSHECCNDYCDRPPSPPYRCSPQPEYCPTCKNPCKPVKTKYVIPCYRYEDGRIVNQPTVLMRRACEVAVGARPKRKPFVESSYRADPDQEVHRYVSQDERGNVCYHYEKKQNEMCVDCCHACHSCPQCGDSVRACPAPPGNCYYHCC